MIAGSLQLGFSGAGMGKSNPNTVLEPRFWDRDWYFQSSMQTNLKVFLRVDP